MKAILKIELEFDSWFDEGRQPKDNLDWTKFFETHLMPQGSVIGIDDGVHQDMIALDRYNIVCTEVI